MAIVTGDKVQAKTDDECYVDSFSGRVGTVVETHREWGGIVATVQFPGGYRSTFFADGLRRVRQNRKASTLEG
jgi:hypothetical protein